MTQVPVHFNNFGEWLRYWRERIGLTQEQLGERVGVSKQQISNLERSELDRNGKPLNPSIELLTNLISFFKVSVVEPWTLLMGGKLAIPDAPGQPDIEAGTEEQRFNQQLATLSGLFAQLPPERRLFVLELMKLLLAGVLATSLTETLTGSLKPLDDDDDAEDYEEQGKKPAQLSGNQN